MSMGGEGVSHRGKMIPQYRTTQLNPREQPSDHHMHDVSHRWTLTGFLRIYPCEILVCRYLRVQTRTFAGPHPLWLAHANTLWMWNTIMHKTEPMSVSYEPALKPLLDKSPPTGVQEFGSLMKKSCCAGRSRSAWLWGFWAPYRGPDMGGSCWAWWGRWWAPHRTVWRFTAVREEIHLNKWEFVTA